MNICFTYDIYMYIMQGLPTNHERHDPYSTVPTQIQQGVAMGIPSHVCLHCNTLQHTTTRRNTL